MQILRQLRSLFCWMNGSQEKDTFPYYIEKMKRKNEKKREEIKMLEQIKEIVAESLNVEADTLTTDTSFKEDLGADSLDLFELVMAFEEAFEIEIPSEDLEEIKTVGDVVSYVESHK